jgi:hypothetical protein
MPTSRTKAELQQQKNKVCVPCFPEISYLYGAICFRHDMSPADFPYQLAQSYNELLEYVNIPFVHIDASNAEEAIGSSLRRTCAMLGTTLLED